MRRRASPPSRGRRYAGRPRRRPAWVSATVVLRWPPTATMPAVDARRPRSAPAHSPARAAGPAAAGDDLNDGIVDRPHDRPVVDEEAGRRSGRAAPAPHRSSMTIGSSLRLPLVATTGKPSSPHQQMMQRRIGQHRAEPRIARRHRVGDRPAGRAAAARSAARRPVSSASSADDSRQLARTGQATETSPRRVSPPAACARAGRAPPPRCARRTSRWKPPMPLTATIRAVRECVVRGRAARSSAVQRASRPASHSASRGPQAGQAFGSAWKRRSAGIVVFRLACRAHGEAGASSSAPGRRACRR